MHRHQEIVLDGDGRFRWYAATPARFRRNLLDGFPGQTQKRRSMSVEAEGIGGSGSREGSPNQGVDQARKIAPQRRRDGGLDQGLSKVSDGGLCKVSGCFGLAVTIVLGSVFWWLIWGIVFVT